MKLGVIDYETKAIGDRPHAYPPEPVSCALLPARGKPIWLAWGHPTVNNCTPAQAKRRIKQFIADHSDLLFHNAAFDVAVTEERMSLDLRDKNLHDSMVLAFLHDPYAKSLGLKELAHRHCGMPPDEMEAVRQWLIENGIVKKNATKAWGAFISEAPGDLVKPYAIGDVIRTKALYEKWRGTVHTPAYQREMKIVRINIDMERRGVPVNTRALVADEAILTAHLVKIDQGLCKAFGRYFNVDEREELADAIEAKWGGVLPTTATGRRSTARATLMDVIPDQSVKAAITHRGALAYRLRTYVRPWSIQATRCNGRVHPAWHSTRSDDDSGARTGRFSSTPNFQNMADPENQAKLIESLAAMDSSVTWSLPDIRKYVQARKGYRIIGRDYSQIELRLAAEFEDGEIAGRYNAEPMMDLHAWAFELIQANGGLLGYDAKQGRRLTKNTGFSILYGGGPRVISMYTGLSLEAASNLKQLYLSALPSLKTLIRDVQDRGRQGGHVTTLGGRVYYPEPAKIVDGAWRSYEYKLLNYLIQGSAADLIKESIIAYVESDGYKQRGDELIMTVHDEDIAEVPAKGYKQSLEGMRVAMIDNELVRKLHVPILSEGYYGPNWFDLKDAA